MKCVCKCTLKITKWLAFFVLLLILLIGLHYWTWLKKAHTVSSGLIYRSAQLSPTEFSQAIHQYKIRAILNLRGEHANKLWYQQERELASQDNILHYDLQMASYTKPTRAQLLQLVDILEKSPKPLLVHCEGGADRTGLASAIALILQDRPLTEAEKEYSLRFYVIHEKSVGRIVIPLYAEWLKKNNYLSSRQNFFNWLAQYS